MREVGREVQLRSCGKYGWDSWYTGVVIPTHCVSKSRAKASRVRWEPPSGSRSRIVMTVLSSFNVAGFKGADGDGSECDDLESDDSESSVSDIDESVSDQSSLSIRLDL